MSAVAVHHGTIRVVTKRRVVLAVILLAVVVGAVGLVTRVDWDSESHFCTTQLSVAGVGGRDAALQDQGSPGRDGCDLGDNGVTLERVRMEYELDYDCLLRNRSGEVVASTTPNRADGTCGQPVGR